MRDEGIAMDDLRAFATPLLDRIQERGNPHFTAKGSQVLAGEIARHIRGMLDKK